MEPIDVRHLLDSPAASRPVRREEALEDLAIEMARVPESHPVHIELVLENVMEGILASGTVSGRMTYHCARCLAPGAAEFRLDVSELFTLEAGDDDDEYPISEGTIDLEPMIRDAVVLSLPFSPLCRPGCLGLCERCGGDRNRGECSCGPAVDPRWSALSELDLD